VRLPEDDVEIRRMTLTNLSWRKREVEITSYAEVVLAPLNADLAHRAFGNLFVTTECWPTRTRSSARAASGGPTRPSRGCFISWCKRELETPRPRTRPTARGSSGRGRGPRTSGRDGCGHRELSGTSGTVLDPIVAIRSVVAIGTDESVTVQIVSGAARTREAAIGADRKITATTTSSSGPSTWDRLGARRFYASSARRKRTPRPTRGWPGP
jgi:hypothetical protein